MGDIQFNDRSQIDALVYRIDIPQRPGLYECDEQAIRLRLGECSTSRQRFYIFFKSNVYSPEARAYVTLRKQRGLTPSNDPSLSVHASLYSQSNVLLPIPSHTCRQVAVNQFVFGGDILLKCVYDEVFFSAR